MDRQINQLLLNAFHKGASDLHISVDSPPLYRINGRLTSFDSSNLSANDTKSLAKEILKEAWNEFNDIGEIDLAYHVEHIVRFRVNVFKQKQNVSIAARVIPTDIPTVEDLNMPLILNDIALQPQGLVLVTGPTGSGKSTTLAAMVDHINRHDKKHIVTLEDPIEYLHNHNKSIIQQREVGSDTKRFSSGLRAALRQDPDVILVGEMRDLDTISTAITAAETGHLVLATLHTNSAVQTVNRIIDAFPAEQQTQIRIQLAAVLAAVISQRLFIRKDIAGRIAATEVLIKHPSIANLIRNEKIEQIDNVLQTSKSLGMHTLSMSIKELMADGKVDYDTVRPYVNNVGDVNGSL